eukprot:scaffold14870_cov107-Amphora_coffeaeformis.AAC.1
MVGTMSINEITKSRLDTFPLGARYLAHPQFCTALMTTATSSRGSIGTMNQYALSSNPVE